MYGEPDTFWLNFTNAALGVVTLICLLAIGAGVVQELLARRRAAAEPQDDHAFVTPELGMTMADGGRRLDEKKPRWLRRVR
jgi:hypothetical protein